MNIQTKADVEKIIVNNRGLSINELSKIIGFIKEKSLSDMLRDDPELADYLNKPVPDALAMKVSDLLFFLLERRKSLSNVIVSGQTVGSKRNRKNVIRLKRSKNGAGKNVDSLNDKRTVDGSWYW